MLFSISACALYVVATYSSKDEQKSFYFTFLENFFNAWFLVDYIFYIWLAEDRCEHVLSGTAICGTVLLI